MKRNWYAAIILLALCVLLFRAGQYVDRTTAGMQRQLEAAYALAEQGDYPAARRAYSRAANRALRSTQVLGLLVRRISACSLTCLFLCPNIIVVKFIVLSNL